LRTGLRIFLARTPPQQFDRPACVAILVPQLSRLGPRTARTSLRPVAGAMLKPTSVARNGRTRHIAR
jgi:hypothetical protein